MFREEVNSFLTNCDFCFLFASPAKSFPPLAIFVQIPMSLYYLLTMSLQDISYCLYKVLYSFQCHLIILQGSTNWQWQESKYLFNTVHKMQFSSRMPALVLGMEKHGESSLGECQACKLPSASERIWAQQSLSPLLTTVSLYCFSWNGRFQ